MKRRTVVGSVGAAALGVVGVSAYTSATVSRAASISVKKDDAADTVIKFSANIGTSLTDGKLKLDADSESLNQRATFEYGDYATPADLNTNENHAFKLTNNDTGTAHDVTVSLTNNNSDHTLSIEGNKGGTVKTISDGSPQTFSSVSSGTSVYFAFELDTEQTNTNPYDGTLEFTLD